jgi:predicted nucleotidyltransferase
VSAEQREHKMERKTIDREEITAAIARALEPLDYVYAMWEGGAVAFGRVDEWSDIDICISAEDDRVEEPFPVVEKALESIAPIELKYEVGGPKLGEYVQAFYRLEGAGPYLLVDFAVFKHSAADKLLEPEIHGNSRFHFNKDGAVAVPALDRGAFIEKVRGTLEDLPVKVDMFAAFIPKEVHRGNLVACVDFYHRFLLVALTQVLRLKHKPARYDFGLRYVHYDLPPEEAKRFEDLYVVRDKDDLLKKYEQARAWFDETAASLELAEIEKRLG